MIAGFRSLYTNRPWRSEPGPDVSVKTLSPNAELLMARYFQRVRHGAFYVKRNGITRLFVLLRIVDGLCPAAAAQLLAVIIHNVQHDTMDSYLLVFRAFPYLAVNIVKDRSK